MLLMGGCSNSVALSRHLASTPECLFGNSKVALLRPMRQPWEAEPLV